MAALGYWVRAISDDAVMPSVKCAGAAGMLFVSVGYRHAPNTDFTTAGRGWLRGDQMDCRGIAVRIGGKSEHRCGRGRSDGANVAAVNCQLARDRGGPKIAAPAVGGPVNDERASVILTSTMGRATPGSAR